jgi:hypothetical protein
LRRRFLARLQLDRQPLKRDPLGVCKPSIYANIGLRYQGDASIIVDSTTVEGVAPLPAAHGKSESTTQTTAPAIKPRIKKEDIDEFDEIHDVDEMVIDDRVDMAQLNFPGGPVSSRRKNDRTVTGWKKIELWIENDEEEDEEEEDVPRLRQVTVKVEDDTGGGIVQEPRAEMMVIDDEVGGVEDEARRTEKKRAKRRKERLRGKTREEKEELARDEVDNEVLKDGFLNPDRSLVSSY